MATALTLARAGNRTAAIGHVTDGPANAQLNAIRTELSAFSVQELDLLGKRQTALATLQNGMRFLICISLAAALALAGLLARSMFATMERLKTRSVELETEMQLRQLAEGTLRQAQKMEAVGQLSGGIAHDFNNLLTIILGNLDIIRRRVSAATAAQGALELAATIGRPLDAALYGTHKSAELVQRLLAFSRRQVLEPVRVDLNRLVADLTDMLHRTLGENINVETILGVGLWPTFADANQVENALVNLCVNARDAMAEGGRLTIETANTHLDENYARQFGDVTAGQYVMLSVTDTGTGITRENLARIFEPFFTTKPTSQGTGLGLATVHGFVKQSGGHIRIYSEIGAGTTVKIYLPRLVETERVATTPVARPADNAVMPRAHDGEKILIVEDNDGVRQYAGAILRELGYTVTEAIDMPSALRAFEADGAIDLLFTDVILPGSTGRVLAEEILKRRPELPVLFTTGYSRNAIIHNGRLDADVQFLGKPYTQLALARKVRELLDGRKE
jgi:signal transduction histidine kinase